VRQVELIQFDIPPLRDGVYTVAVTHTAGQGAPDSFAAKTTFAVSGERFSLAPSEIAGVFPPNLANGEYAGILPHVLLSRRTLPWEREALSGESATPWLAVLLFDEDEWARVSAYQSKQVADLVPAGEAIKPVGKQIQPGVGTMPAGTVSYPGLTQLEVGEAPTDTVAIVDVPADLFSKVAPTTGDLPYLAHIRKVDTSDSVDQASAVSEVAVVLGNRLPADGSDAHAVLVSLEGMGPYLPHADGTPSTSLTAATVRLTTFQTWRFFANTGGETFLQLVESLNTQAVAGDERLSTLQVPFTGAPPSSDEVTRARAAQAVGSISGAVAQVLLHDAFGMGYVPLRHRLRHGGETVSWYRGPLAPYPVLTKVAIPLAGPDQATRYDRQTGMFDVSYAAAWQLGQLLAVRDRSFALAVANWRCGLVAADAVAQEQALIERCLAGAFDGVVARRRERVQAATAVDEFPPAITLWLAKLRRLEGIPFNYLVPEERMLPPESVRMFHVDNAWMDALLDGALSIGRSTTGELTRHAEHARALHVAAFDHAATLRANRSAVTLEYIPEELTGLLLRSQVVAGWPRLNVAAWSDTGQQSKLKLFRMQRISNDVLLCLWHGVLADFAVRESPEQLHCGVEQAAGAFSTTLRDVTGPKPGIQFKTDPKGGLPQAVVPTRSDRQTIQVASAATSILDKLNIDFAQGIAPAAFTSAEFALEMVKGVADVEFRLGG
jgi:hypothetical protein